MMFLLNDSGNHDSGSLSRKCTPVAINRMIPVSRRHLLSVLFILGLVIDTMVPCLEILGILSP